MKIETVHGGHPMHRFLSRPTENTAGAEEAPGSAEWGPGDIYRRNGMDTLELAQAGDIDVCSEIIRAGREFQQEQGFVQWTEDYPNRDTIQEDVKDQIGYVVKTDGQIAGYMCIDFGGEPAYHTIQGQWRTEEPYAVVHRMAFSKGSRGKGLTQITFDLIKELCRSKGVKSIRVDTGLQNQRMQHILEKNGFRYCGVIIFQGSEKMAYDLAL